MESKELLKWLKKISLQNGLMFKRIKDIERILNDMSGEQLEKFIMNFSSPQMEIQSFNFPDVWQTVVIKSCPNKEAFKAAIVEQGIQIVETASKVVDYSEYTILLEEDIEANLVLVSVRELGFSKGAYLNSIKKKAKNEGLKLYAPEMAPLLRLYLRKQPVEVIHIAMNKPVKLIEEEGDKAELVMFCLTDDSIYESLDISDARQYAFYPPDEFFLFVKPRK